MVLASIGGVGAGGGGALGSTLDRTDKRVDIDRERKRSYTVSDRNLEIFIFCPLPVWKAQSLSLDIR